MKNNILDTSNDREDKFPRGVQSTTGSLHERRKFSRSLRCISGVAFAVLLLPLGGLATQKSLEIIRLNSLDLMQFDEALEFWRAGSAPEYLSMRDAKILLSSCLQLTADWRFLLQSDAVRGGVLGHCVDTAGAVGAGMSEASSLRALAAIYGGDSQLAARELDAAWREAPSDLWLALSRIDIALEIFGDLGGGGDLSRLARELELLGRTHRGVDTAVWLYVKYPAIRGELTRVAEVWEPKIRLRFLKRLKFQIGEMQHAS